ncbi:MAG: hypothetical protein M3Y87_02490 [Myxococcota bacterium]|nr:hypothetical protein [Myxococcota bacterium]
MANALDAILTALRRTKTSLGLGVTSTRKDYDRVAASLGYRAITLDGDRVFVRRTPVGEWLVEVLGLPSGALRRASIAALGKPMHQARNTTLRAPSAGWLADFGGDAIVVLVERPGQLAYDDYGDPYETGPHDGIFLMAPKVAAKRFSEHTHLVGPAAKKSAAKKSAAKKSAAKKSPAKKSAAKKIPAKTRAR